MLDRPRTQLEINRFRRESLIAATLSVIAEKGIDKTTIADICTAVGVSRGLANHYFDSKDQLLAAAYEALYLRLEEIWTAATEQEASPARKILTTICVTLTQDFFQPTIRAASLSFWSAALSNPALAVINRERYGRYHRSMTDLFAEAARERGVGIDAQRAALTVIGAIDGRWLGLALNNGQFDASEAYSACKTLVGRLLFAPADDPDFAEPLHCERKDKLGPK